MIKRLLRTTAEFALDLVFPEMCMFCGELLDGGIEAKRYLTCEDCLCLFDSEGAVICDSKNGRFCLFRYEGQAEAVVKQFKYSGKKRYAYSAGLLMAKYTDCKKVDLLVPVPLHEARLKQRGYNQAAVICGAFSVALNIPVLDVLQRVKETQALFGLTKEERERAVCGAFALDATKTGANNCSPLQGKTIALVDDILTTGATLDECAKVLVANGAKEVKRVTFAWTPPPSYYSSD